MSNSPTTKKGAFWWLKRIGGGGKDHHNNNNNQQQQPELQSQLPPLGSSSNAAQSPSNPGRNFQEKANWRKSGSHILDVFRASKKTEATTSLKNISGAGDLASLSLNSPRVAANNSDFVVPKRNLKKSQMAVNSSASAPPHQSALGSNLKPTDDIISDVVPGGSTSASYLVASSSEAVVRRESIPPPSHPDSFNATPPIISAVSIATKSDSIVTSTTPTTTTTTAKTTTTAAPSTMPATTATTTTTTTSTPTPTSTLDLNAADLGVSGASSGSSTSRSKEKKKQKKNKKKTKTSDKSKTSSSSATLPPVQLSPKTNEKGDSSPDLTPRLDGTTTEPLVTSQSITLVNETPAVSIPTTTTKEENVTPSELTTLKLSETSTPPVETPTIEPVKKPTNPAMMRPVGAFGAAFAAFNLSTKAPEPTITTIAQQDTKEPTSILPMETKAPTKEESIKEVNKPNDQPTEPAEAVKPPTEQPRVPIEEVKQPTVQQPKAQLSKSTEQSKESIEAPKPSMGINWKVLGKESSESTSTEVLLPSTLSTKPQSPSSSTKSLRSAPFPLHKAKTITTMISNSSSNNNNDNTSFSSSSTVNPPGPPSPTSPNQSGYTATVQALVDGQKYRPAAAAKYAENRRSLKISMTHIRSLFGGSGIRKERSSDADSEGLSKSAERRFTAARTEGLTSTLSPLQGAIANRKDTTDEEKSAANKKRASTTLKSSSGSQLKREQTPVSIESEILIANNFEELPKDIQRKIISAKIDVQSLEVVENWRILCNILHFRLKKRIFPTTLELEKPQKKVKDNFRQLDVTLEEAEVLYFTPEDSKKNPRKIYKNFLDCGKGGYGRVFSATSAIDKDNEKVAIKKMPHTTEKERRHNLSEIRFLHLIEHPNICRYLRTHNLKDEVWIIMEYMQGGTLNEAVKQHEFSEGEIAYVAREVLQGLVFLHQKKWVHRDLKSSNIMLTCGGEIKLIDFGLCIDVSEGGSTHMCGSPYWMSPEMIRKEVHGIMADIWSFGISLLELANKHPPNHKNALLALYTAATVGYPQPFERPSMWGEEFRHFMNVCLALDPDARPSSEKLLTHPFMQRAVERKRMEALFSRLFLTNAIIM